MTTRRRIALAALLLAGSAVLVVAQGCDLDAWIAEQDACRAACAKQCMIVRAIGNVASGRCLCDARQTVAGCEVAR